MQVLARAPWPDLDARLVLQPFVEEGQPITKLFPSSDRAAVVPLYGILLVVCVAFITVGVVVIVEQIKRCASAVVGPGLADMLHPRALPTPLPPAGLSSGSWGPRLQLPLLPVW